MELGSEGGRSRCWEDGRALFRGLWGLHSHNSDDVAVLMGSGSADPCSGEDGGHDMYPAGRELSILMDKVY